MDYLGKGRDAKKNGDIESADQRFVQAFENHSYSSVTAGVCGKQDYSAVSEKARIQLAVSFTNSTEASITSNKRERKFNRRLIIICPVIVVFFLGCLVAVYFFTKGSSTEVLRTEDFKASTTEISTADDFKASTTEVSTADDFKASTSEVSRIDDFKASTPEVSTANDFKASTPEVSTADDFKASTSEVSRIDDFKASTPEVSTANDFKASTPEVSTANDFKASTTEVSTANDFKASTTEVSTANDFKASTPELSTAGDFKASTTEVSTADDFKVQCPNNYTKCENEKCGRFCYRYESNQCQSWFDARQICQNEGGDLMVPSECTYQFFREQASLNEGSCSQFWIGGRTETPGYNYVTVKGDVIPQDSSFSYWSITQPDGLGGESCLEMRMNFNNYLMNDYHCEEKEGFICQFFLK